jgi:UDP-N-acetylmuramate--alanine ligase
MNFNKVTHIYFIGIGGIGMSALARYFKAMGKVVAGYDKTPTSLTQELINEQIPIHFHDAIEAIPEMFKEASNFDQVLVVYTPAIPGDHAELNFFRQKNFHVVKRSQVLGILTASSTTYAVAGTHGKTTTSSLLAHILKSSGCNVAAFLGGIAKNYQSNLILPQGNTNLINVVEADEFDRSFLTLFPDAAIITSLDADHLDIYGTSDELKKTYLQFATQVRPNGLLAINANISFNQHIPNAVTYAVDRKADYFASDITIVNHQYHFNLNTPDGVMKDLCLGLPGRHNVENAVAAIVLAKYAGVNNNHISEALQSYSGVKRRFDLRFSNESTTYIDDYAHHPEELRATIQSVKELYQGKKVCGIFQPHLFSRTRDFAIEFAESLSLLDEVIMLDIYPAREMPIPGITSRTILDLIPNSNKQLMAKHEVVEYINKHSPPVLITLGAGDIDTLVEPLQIMLEKKYEYNR